MPIKRKSTSDYGTKLTEHWFFRIVLTTTFSISLAFTIDRFYDDYKRSAQVNAVAKNLYVEYKGNIGSLDSAITDLRMFRAALFKYRYDSLYTLMQIASEPPYLHLVDPMMQVHDYLRQQEGLKENFDLLSQLSKTEKSYEGIKEMNSRLTKLLWSLETNSHRSDGQLLKLLVINITGNYIVDLLILRNDYIETLAYLQKKRIVPPETLPKFKVLDARTDQFKE